VPRINAHECGGLLQRSDFVFLAVACGSFGKPLAVALGMDIFRNCEW
jgi:hypothetical protein